MLKNSKESFHRVPRGLPSTGLRGLGAGESSRPGNSHMVELRQVMGEKKGC